MDMFKGNPDEDNMMDVEPWLSVPGSSGLDDPAEGMFPDASPAPNLPGELCCCPAHRHALPGCSAHTGWCTLTVTFLVLDQHEWPRSALQPQD